MKIGFIGTGKITSAMVEAICTSELSDFQIKLSPRNVEISKKLEKNYDLVTRMDWNQDVVDQSDLVFIALRPSVYKNILGDLKFREEQSVISLIPFLQFKELEKLVRPASQISRAIPLPTVVNHVCPIPIFNPGGEALELFNMIGQPFIINSEEELHTIWTLTCLISPFYDLMSNLSNWAIENTVNKELADKYLADMFNSLAFAASESDHPDFEALSQHAATPGGLNERTGKEIVAAGAHQAYIDTADGVRGLFPVAIDAR